MESETKYLPELMAEKDSLDPSFTHAMSLLASEIERLKKGGEPRKDEEDTYLDLFSHKNMKLKERILIPVKLYPRFNFVGKILGPQGNTIKRLQEETGAKISVLGKGSMRDKAKEEELRKGGDPKYNHLNMDLHVFIEVFGPPCEAYTRMAHAMEEVKKFLVPDMMDDICQEQFLELSYLNGAPPETARGGRVGPGRGRGVPTASAPASRGRAGAIRPLVPRGAPGRGSLSRGASVSRSVAPASASRGAPSARARAASIQRISLPPPAAEAYDEYGYDDPYAEQSYEAYESYYSQSPGDTEYYDYGHGEGPEAYESYGQDNWNGARPSLKVPSAPKGSSYRDHPYRRF
ncbi:KH domain-containing, RNA-binding, signal transduction-associated protein 1 isoform X1 [Bufo gargarizans]|uniref:KH domain-containing, RNA-binding, signal transduction-associated protein 1 isoform X1 n=1 Tax=Bufo gargarizans TaxID=30331 RepID=UPI001CF5D638|nr:KH domain-containing, RNA-binding, signal transduction-associated protein 1 isoform X1 [Bufo gargarizans]